MSIQYMYTLLLLPKPCAKPFLGSSVGPSDSWDSCALVVDLPESRPVMIRGPLIANCGLRLQSGSIPDRDFVRVGQLLP